MKILLTKFCHTQVSSIIALLLLFIAQGISSEEIKLLIEPFEFEAIQIKQYNWIASDMNDSISKALSGLPKLKLFSSEDRKKILKEVGFMQQIGSSLEEDPFAQIKKPNLILSGKLILQDNQLKTNIRLTVVRQMNAKVIVVNERFSINTLDGYYNKVLLEIIKHLETLNDSLIENLVLSEETKSEFKIKKLYNPKAIEYYYNGKKAISEDYLKAQEYFQKAIQLEPEYVDAIISLGSIYSLNKKDFSSASVEYEKALAIFNNLGDNESYRYNELLTLIASNYYSQGDFSQSLEKYYEAKVGLETLSLNDSLSMAYIEYGIGICYSGMNKRQKAITHFKNAKNIFDSIKIQNSIGYANILFGMAYVQLGLNELDNALESYKQAYKIYSTTNQNETVIFANILYSIGYILEKKNETKEAAKYFKKAYSIYEKNGYEGKEKQSSKLRAESLGRK